MIEAPLFEPTRQDQILREAQTAVDSYWTKTLLG